MCSYSTHKLSPRSTAYIFLGYFLTQSAYLCLDPSTSRVYVSCHVDFKEFIFPYTHSISSSSHHNNVSETASTPMSYASLAPISTLPLTALSHDAPHAPRSETPQPPEKKLEPENPEPAAHETYVVDPVTTSSTADTAPNPPTQRMKFLSMNHIWKPNPKYGLTAILIKIEPEMINQALKDKKWCGSATGEFNSLIDNHTLELGPPLEDQNAVGCSWLFCTKHLPNGSVRKRRSRLVAKGYYQ